MAWRCNTYASIFFFAAKHSGLTFAAPKFLLQEPRPFMANHKATKKDIRQNEKRRERNRYYGKTTRNAIRKLLAQTDNAAATAELPKVISMIDKLAKRNVIHRNKAANLKSGLAKRLAAKAAA